MQFKSNFNSIYRRFTGVDSSKIYLSTFSSFAILFSHYQEDSYSKVFNSYKKVAVQNRIGIVKQSTFLIYLLYEIYRINLSIHKKMQLGLHDLQHSFVAHIQQLRFTVDTVFYKQNCTIAYNDLCKKT